MAAKTTSGSGFDYIFGFSMVDLVEIDTKLEIVPLTLFRENWPLSWKIQKFIKRVTEISHGEIFDILRQLCPPATVPKFSNFHRRINFLRRFAFLDLVVFWLKKRLWALGQSSDVYISKSWRARNVILSGCLVNQQCKLTPQKVCPHPPRWGLQGAPKMLSRAIFSKISLFRRPLCQNLQT